eukprot:gene12578-3277_t
MASKEEDSKAFPLKRNEVLKWNGWGYKDSKFVLQDNGVVAFTGDRYGALAGELLPKLREWFEKECGADMKLYSPSRPKINIQDYEDVKINDAFLDAAKRNDILISMEAEERIVHGHGHTLHEIFALRHGKLQRIPDAVIWPKCHEEVVKVVQLASQYNVCLIPFGGGTSVSGAVQCPEDEARMIVSVDMTNMDKILWVDDENLTAHIEAGIIGQDLERKLEKQGFCTGHEPDSMEFSSLGGWVATRASGMKKNRYGNIEDLVVRIKAVTPIGTVEKSCQVPRMSAGPDIHHFILGSEGTLGLVTEVTIKIRPLPECKTYGSVIFPEFEAGIACLREIAKLKCTPASIRLMDNAQFQFGQALKPGSTPVWTSIVPKYGGIPAGVTNGKRGYTLTFVIAYLRDLGFDYHFIAESFETSVPWDRVSNLCRNVKALLAKKCSDFNIIRKPLVTCRVTQAYDSGACVYFYFGFNYYGIENPVLVYETIENAARDEIIANGGSISHHHGIGKIRKRWLESTISNTGTDMIRAVKEKNMDRVAVNTLLSATPWATYSFQTLNKDRISF